MHFESRYSSARASLIRRERPARQTTEMDVGDLSVRELLRLVHCVIEVVKLQRPGEVTLQELGRTMTAHDLGWVPVTVVLSIAQVLSPIDDDSDALGSVSLRAVQQMLSSDRTDTWWPE